MPLGKKRQPDKGQREVNKRTGRPRPIDRPADSIPYGGVGRLVREATHDQFLS
ncbi:MAG: hypothetical protein AAF958_10175 [Planctomycetota bacterium]